MLQLVCNTRAVATSKYRCSSNITTCAGSTSQYAVTVLLTSCSISSPCVDFPMCNCSWSFVYCVTILCIFLLPAVLCYSVCLLAQVLIAWLLASGRYPEGRAVTGHLAQGLIVFSLSKSECWDGYRDFQAAAACFLCSPPDLDPYFTFMYMHNNHCHRATAHLQ
jgi:hypothetical protein